MIEKKLSNATPLDDENVVLRRSDNNFLNKTQITNCILSAPNGVATYSGNTVTIKKGLKGLIPDGLNSDGTYKNIEYIMENDAIGSFNYGSTNSYLTVNSEGPYLVDEQLSFFIQDTQPDNTNNTYILWYNPKTNYLYCSEEAGTPFVRFKGFIIGDSFNKNSDGTITHLNVFQPVNLLKQSDKSQISGWGMPSNRTIDLTLGVAQSTYTAPANGWFFCISQASNNAGYEYIYVGCGFTPSLTNYTYVLSDDISRAPGTSGKIAPVRKGDQIMIDYGYVSNRIFRFIYAEGEL